MPSNVSGELYVHKRYTVISSLFTNDLASSEMRDSVTLTEKGKECACFAVMKNFASTYPYYILC